MKTVATLGGEGRGRYDSSSLGFKTALEEGERTFRFLDVDVPWFEPINLADYGPGGQLAMHGEGYLATNIQKNYTGPLPMLYDWSFLRWPQWSGINWLGRAEPGFVGPLTSFAYVDQFDIRNVVWQGSSGNGCEWGVAPTGQRLGYIAEGVFDHVACFGAGLHGMVIRGGRNLTIAGRSRFERNGQYNLAMYHGLDWLEDPAAEAVGASTIRDNNFEHDDPRHLGLYIRGGRSLTVGPNRYVQCGYDIVANNSTFGGSEVQYGAGSRIITGYGNKNNTTTVRP